MWESLRFQASACTWIVVMADGIVAHWNNSCGIWNSYVKRRLPGYEAAGIPTVMIEADMVDARFFDKTKITGQLDNFIQSF